MKRKAIKYNFIFVIISIGLLRCGNKTNNINESIAVIGNDTVLKIDSNGISKEIYQIKGGKKSGFYYIYDNKGKLTEKGTVVEDRKIGLIKTYENSILKSVNYFENNIKVYELNKEDFEYELLNFKAFKINFPKSWEKKINPQENVLLIGRKNCDSVELFCPSISITKENLKTSLSDYCSNALLIMREKVEKLKVINQNHFKINNYDIIQTRYMILTNGRTLGLQTGFCKINNEVYVLTGTALNESQGTYLKYDGLFEEIILSIQD